MIEDVESAGRREVEGGPTLVTSACLELWPEDDRAVLLGEWCRGGALRGQVDVEQVPVLPYHWDDRAKLDRDRRALDAAYERLLADLGDRLNHENGVDRSPRYWRILVGPWLARFVHTTFDRWSNLQVAKAHGIRRVAVGGGPGDWIPTDMVDFGRLVTSEPWNQHLYARLVRDHVGFPDVSLVAGPAGPERAQPQVSVGLGSAKEWALEAFSSISGRFSRRTDPFLMSTFTRWRDEMMLSARLGAIPQLRRTVPAVRRVEPSSASRDVPLRVHGDSEFDGCVSALVPAMVPTAYLEGYGALLEEVERSGWPAAPKVIWTSRIYRDDVLKAYVAEKVEQGSPLVVGQHGGYHGTKRWMADEDHEVKVSDRYLTWGWDRSEEHVVPIGYFRPIERSARDHAANDRVFLVQTADQQQPGLAEPMLLGRHWLDYFEDQCRFVAALPSAIESSLTVRLYPNDFGWRQAERWAARFPEVRLEDSGPMAEVMDEARVFVGTYMGTAYLQALAMGVPTIVFWDPSHWQIREDAQPYFDLLRRVGVFHDSPESAAEHLAAVWEDPLDWWESPEVVEAVERFTRRFAHLPDDLLGDLERVLETAGATLARDDERLPGPDEVEVPAVVAVPAEVHRDATVRGPTTGLHLVTTAIQSTWPTDGRPVLFLGEWCRRYSRTADWTDLGGSTVRFHWDDQDRLEADSEIVDQAYEERLAGLIEVLNRHHGTDHGERYWRILIGPWLYRAISALRDRWSSVMSAVEAGATETVAIPFERGSTIPTGTTEFGQVTNSEEGNHHLFAEILDALTEVEVRWLDGDPRPLLRAGSAPDSGHAGPPIERALDAYGRLAARFVRDGDAFVYSSFLRWRDVLAVNSRLRQFPALWRGVCEPPHVEPDLGLRDDLFDVSGEGFEACLDLMLPRLLPTAYLEGYEAMLAAVDGLPWPKRPKVICTANPHTDDLFKAYVAQNAEAGSPVAVAGHSGQHGIMKWFWLEDHEHRISDRILSWGPVESDPAAREIGYFRARRPLEMDPSQRDRLLLVLWACRNPSNEPRTELLGRQWIDYFEDHCEFAGRLPREVREAMVVRVHANDRGWDQQERWRDRVPEAEIDDGRGPITDQVQRSRLYVATYPGTNNLEALVMGVPTIYFWRPEICRLRPEAVEWYRRLQDVGVFHATPESAANHVAEAWKDVDGWWRDPEVSAVVSGFVEKYCPVRGGIPARIAGHLREVAVRRPSGS